MKKFTVSLTAAELQQLESLRRDKTELTLHELFVKTLEFHWSTARYSNSGWRKEVINLYGKNIKNAFGKIKLSQITMADVKKWHKSMEDRPTTANRALSVLSRLYSFAIEEGIQSITHNPTSNVARFKEKKRKRYATSEEIKKVGSILEREAANHPSEVTFIFLLMLTGARPRSIERTELNKLKLVGDHGVISFSGKTSSDSGEDEVVVIPSFCVKLLNELDINRRTLVGIKFPRAFWDRVRVEAGCPDLWARDWRRTFATVGLSSGVSSSVIGEVLNHRSAQTTKRYALLLDDKRLAAVEQISKTIENLLND